MADLSICAQCGPGSIATGVLYERKPAYSDIFDKPVHPQWAIIGSMCDRHLKINGNAARNDGYEIKIEPLSPGKIETKG